MTILPTDPKARKNIPLMRGLHDYFPNALAAVAEVSRIGNEQHNPGEEMHWAFDKSTDEPDCIVRHLQDRGEIDTDGVRHSAKVAWRALALLERELIAAGKRPGRAVRMGSTAGVSSASSTPSPRRMYGYLVTPRGQLKQCEHDYQDVCELDPKCEEVTRA